MKTFATPPGEGLSRMVPGTASGDAVAELNLEPAPIIGQGKRKEISKYHSGSLVDQIPNQF